ncbi:DUF1822 family protein [Phormidesmis priestleyi]
MTFSTHPEFALPLPIPRSALATARQFANEQPTPQKAAQIQLNTLAVSVVSDYLPSECVEQASFKRGISARYRIYSVVEIWYNRITRAG